ncbi:MAG: Hpt domain-containing protein, partial [Planctomycetota bacterium]
MAAADPVQQFVLEARDALARMTSAVMALERGAPDFAAQLDELLRATHSVKGGAGFSGLTTIAQLAHALESAVENLRGVNTAPPAEVIDHLLFAMDRLAALIDDAAHSAGADISEPLARLRLVGAAETPAAPLAQWSASGAPLLPARAAPGEFPLSERVLEAGRQAAFLYGVKLDWWACERNFGLPPLALAARLEQAGRVLDSRFELSGPALQAGLPQPPLWYWAIVATSLALEEFAALLPGAAVVRLTYAPVAGPAPHVATPPRPPAGPGAVRIPVALVDRMMGLAGELVLVRNEALHAADADDRPARPLFRRLDAITNELQDAALRMRMQPVGTLFDRFPRLVRDLA